MYSIACQVSKQKNQGLRLNIYDWDITKYISSGKIQPSLKVHEINITGIILGVPTKYCGQSDLSSIPAAGSVCIYCNYRQINC